jgi:hypothetical protein
VHTLIMLCALLLGWAGWSVGAQAQTPLIFATLSLKSPPELVFSSARDACDGHDVPDTSARAYRDAAGAVVVFAMHYQNRALRGPDFDRLKLDCAIVFASKGDENPALYQDKSWITATWTDNGRDIAALLHHEYQANTHEGRCRFKEYIKCWYNSVLGASSSNGGQSFKAFQPPAVIAAAPFRQTIEQGRHRGFFNPSNIFSDGVYYYFFSSTTGWNGQPYGACLFRSSEPMNPTSWRAYDGEDFTVFYSDPYQGRPRAPKPCLTIKPFPAPIGSVTRHRTSGQWIGVFQAQKNDRDFPVSGFYYATSKDLIRWSAPKLLMAGKTLYDDACKAGPQLINYPSLIDHQARGRNFDDIGDEATLYYTILKLKGCEITSDRNLVRQNVRISPSPQR